MSLVRVYPIHEKVCTVQLEKLISPDTFQVLERIQQAILKKFEKEITESTLSYTSATFFLQNEKNLDEYCIQFQQLATAVLNNQRLVKKNERTTIRIPVCYDISFAPDLVAASDKLMRSKEEIIKLHMLPKYQVYTIGFVPGFPYMGEVDARLNLPRKTTPATRVAPGSVAIAGLQTGIYPVEVAGGWHVIGRTPSKLFDKHREKPCLLEAGDQVEFYQITKEEFENWNESDCT
ncbi:MAG: 5-oxoprolinase subunit PxpB [Bacteroidetes bacterium]|nr:5-oxoprolinase subunit PxpB [Bacteroidota bacterium]